MTGIQWTDETWNPVVGCTRVSAGCDHCYAVAMTHRLEKMAEADEAYGRNVGKKAHYRGLTVLNPRGDRHFNGTVRCVESALAVPLSWRKPRRVFVNSMSDLFHRDVPFEFIDRVFAVMALCPQHTFQVLTKRPERMAEYMNAEDAESLRSTRRTQRIANEVAGMRPLHFASRETDAAAYERYLKWPLPNVWLGTSCEDQAAADKRIPHLIGCPAAVRFVSCEPLLGEVVLPIHVGCRLCNHPGNCYPRDSKCICGGSGQEPSYIDWVIVGGESGEGARPCDVEHIRWIVEHCKAAGVPVFVKQLGRWITGPHDFDGWKGCIDRWLLQTDDGRQGTCYRPAMRATYHPEFYDERPTNAVAWGLGDPKGGKPAEWPEDLRVRQMPGERRKDEG